MKILDFLFYYLVRLFDVTDSKHIKFKSHPDQAAYVLTICSGFWLILINGVIEYFIFDTLKSKIPTFIFIIIGLLLYFVYRDIYIKKGRYNLILERSDPKFNVSDKAGRIIVVIVVFSSLLLLMLSAIILHSIK